MRRMVQSSAVYRKSLVNPQSTGFPCFSNQCYNVINIIFLSLFLFFICPTMAGAEPQPYIVKDINSSSLQSSPANLTNVNGVLYFTATAQLTGLSYGRVMEQQ